MSTFSQFRRHPSLLTPELSSPIIHLDGTITVLWEGDPGTALPLCVTEWLATPVPLRQIPGTRIWGTDLDAPPLPRTICSYVRVMVAGKHAPSPRHHPELRGPDLPSPLSRSSASMPLAEDVTLRAPELAGYVRRIRVYIPPVYSLDRAYPALFWLDAQSAIDQLQWLPALPQMLFERGEMPPVMIVAIDHGGFARAEEYVAEGRRNHAARTWMWETVLPSIAARYRLAQRWVVGSSNGASMALQLILANPGVFDGGILLSPRHHEGLEAVLALAEQWPGGGRFFLGQGDFGLREQEALPGSEMLAQRLRARGADIHLAIRHGYGHTFDAFFLLLLDGLRWLFAAG